MFFLKNCTDRVWMMKGQIVLIFFTLQFVSCKEIHSQSLSNDIKLNQEGFYPNAPKSAVITNHFSSKEFYLTTENLKDTFFTGVLSAVKQSAYSSTKTRIADFSSFTRPGKYRVVNGLNHSYPFQIKNNVNHNAAVAVLKGYYFQRTSMPLEEKYAGKWQRTGFHPDDVVYIHPSELQVRNGLKAQSFQLREDGTMQVIITSTLLTPVLPWVQSSQRMKIFWNTFNSSKQIFLKVRMLFLIF